MKVSRRSILGLAAAHSARTWAQTQGMASRGVKPAPRGKPSGLPFGARFSDIAKQAGLSYPSLSGYPDHADYITEVMTGGAAFLDYDNDGWMDVLVLSAKSPSRLYRNNRNGTFTDVTEKAGLLRTVPAYGVTVGDFNNDGFEDLFITCFGQNILYRNNGDGTFTDVTKQAGLLSATSRFGSGCAWVDYNRDGLLDLFVSNYVTFDQKTIPKPTDTGACNYMGVPVNCGPRGLPYGHHLLYRNNGDGTFTDVTAAAGIDKVPGGFGLTVAAADLDNDGWPDIYLACDSTPSLLFRNNHDGTFSEEGIERGVALSEDGMEQAGMGLGLGDFMSDGSLGIIKTHFREDTPALYVSNAKGTFRDVTVRSGLAVETRFVSWGAGIFDFDNDGNPDIFWVTGNIYPEVERKYPHVAHKTPRVLFRNLGGGQFEELMGQAGPGVEEAHSSRGCAFGDFDNDGDVDILIVNQNEPPSLLRNDVTGGNHWLKILLKGVKSNRSAIGARVTVRYGGRTQMQDVMSQSSYLSVNDRRLHFGLGRETAAEIEVRWPLGQVEKIGRVESDKLIEITEGSGITRAGKLR